MVPVIFGHARTIRDRRYKIEQGYDTIIDRTFDETRHRYRELSGAGG